MKKKYNIWHIEGYTGRDDYDARAVGRVEREAGVLSVGAAGAAGCCGASVDVAGAGAGAATGAAGC